MRVKLVERINAEEKVALAKWDEHDQGFDNLLSGALEELGEVAHALNHDEGKESAQQEIVETMGILSRLYDMVDFNTSMTRRGDETSMDSTNQTLRRKT